MTLSFGSIGLGVVWEEETSDSTNIQEFSKVSKRILSFGFLTLTLVGVGWVDHCVWSEWGEGGAPDLTNELDLLIVSKTLYIGYMTLPWSKSCRSRVD